MPPRRQTTTARARLWTNRPPVGGVGHTGTMAETMPLAALGGPIQSLVRRAAGRRERVTLIDSGEPTAVVISAEELEDLEDALAVAQSRLREAGGEAVWISHEDVRRHLGLGQ